MYVAVFTIRKGAMNSCSHFQHVKHGWTVAAQPAQDIKLYRSGYVFPLLIFQSEYV